MLTGDRWSVAKKVAGELGCTEVQGECLPEHKLRLVEAMRREGNMVAVVVAMVSSHCSSAPR